MTLSFSPAEMMVEAEKYALAKTTKSTRVTVVLAMMAGVFIGLAFVFYITVTTGNGSMNWGLTRLAGGLVFSIGLILIVICGGELFTSSVLSSIAWANKQITLSNMLSVWGKVYIGNYLGAMALVILVMGASLYQMDNGQWGLNALKIAQYKLQHSFTEAFALGILCNLLVCLAIWMTFSTPDVLTKALMTMLPVALFVSSGFEHCVANMFMIPLGIIIQHFAPQSFWDAIATSPLQFSDVTFERFLIANLIPVTLGNIVGGAGLVGFVNWCLYRRPIKAARSINLASSHCDKAMTEEIDMTETMMVSDIMTLNPITLTCETPIPNAMDILIDNLLISAPVCDAQGQLMGFFSVHDVMVDLWCDDYVPNPNRRVLDVMSREIITISPTDSLMEVVEFMCIDKEQLYPVARSGIATTLSTLTLEERAKSIRVSKPHVLPVVDKGQLVGVLTRQHVLQGLRRRYVEKVLAVSA
ncbi:formate transporter FocA [Vibrio ostreicida]|uniref:formate transporter FocA n=1 Tax=Vibrio ostreicida TaxID=526588 RepID=UPI000970273D|nr:formate transporter FocA [Vibrio ostreicida]